MADQTDSVLFFLRRKSKCPEGSDEYEYLFLTAEGMALDAISKLTAPQLPGNDVTTVGGKTSTNFILNIGFNGFSIQVDGAFQDVDMTEVPPNIHYMCPSYTVGTRTFFPAASVRTTAIDFLASQGDYEDIALGWPDWYATESINFATGKSTDCLDDSFGLVSTNKVPYRIWNGNVEKITTKEVAGEIRQYQYSLSFKVGQS